MIGERTLAVNARNATLSSRARTAIVALEQSASMRRAATVLVAIALLVAVGCGGTSTRDPVADAGASLRQVQRGTMHLELDLAAGAEDPHTHVGFAMNGAFDLAPAGGSLPAADLTTVNLGMPNARPAHFVSTAHDAYIVRGDVGYELTAEQLAPLRTAGSTGNSSAGAGLDLRGWAINLRAQAPTTTGAGEAVDRVTGGVDPVAALNGIVDLAGQLGGGPDPALHISPADAGRVRAAAQSSDLEVLTGRDDHLLRSLTGHVQFAAPTAAGPTTGGAVMQALNHLGHLTLTIELRLDHPNVPVTIAPPATIRPISEMPND